MCLVALGENNRRGRDWLKGVAWHERLVTDQTQPAGRQAYSGCQTQVRSGEVPAGSTVEFLILYQAIPYRLLPRVAAAEEWLYTSFPGSSASTAAAHTYIPQHPTTRPLSASSCSSSCLSLSSLTTRGALRAAGAKKAWAMARLKSATKNAKALMVVVYLWIS